MMNDPAQPLDHGASAPPHPFRVPAWDDPRTEHRPCMCPRCCPPEGTRPRLRPWRIALCVAGGAVWPLAALLCNTAFHVVELGTAGTAALLVTAASSLVNLVLLPTRHDPVGRRVVVSAPRAAWLRVALLLGALWSCLCWGYLGLLMLPLLPISVIAILWMGIGLCGLTPFAATAVALVQSVRAARSVSERLGRRATRILVAGGLVLPLLGGVVVGLHVWQRRLSLERQLARIAEQAPHSEERLRAITAMAGREAALPRLYAHLDADRQRAAAEAYLLLTDQRLNEPAERAARGQQALIRPLWFLDGHGLPLGSGAFLGGSFWRF